MGSIKRSMQRKKKLKEAKKAKKSLKHALKATAGLPSTCSRCNKSFSPDDDADTWMVTMFESALVLSCPECYQSDELAG